MRLLYHVHVLVYTWWSCQSPALLIQTDHITQENTSILVWSVPCCGGRTLCLSSNLQTWQTAPIPPPTANHWQDFKPNGLFYMVRIHLYFNKLLYFQLGRANMRTENIRNKHYQYCNISSIILKVKIKM